MNHRSRYFAAVTLLVISSSPVRAETPEFRPALLGNFPRSLINTINTESLMKRGQKDGIVMFTAGISNSGYGYVWQTYRGNTEFRTPLQRADGPNLPGPIHTSDLQASSC